MNDKLLKITGEIEHIVFKNDTNGYTVFTMDVDGDPLTCVGNLPGVDEGSSVILYGHYTIHPTYGNQFLVETFEKAMPESITGIIKFLSSGAIKGIGASTATRLVKKFGSKTLEVLENEPERVAKVKGITIEKARHFQSQLKSKIDFTKLLDYLKEYKIDSEKVTAIYKLYGDTAIKRIEENPYILCDEKIGVSFELCDMIARDKDIPEDSDYRVKSGILYVIKFNKSNGHTCVKRRQLTDVSARLLGLDEEIIDKALKELITDGSLYLCQFEGNDFIFSAEMFEAETYAAKEIRMMLNFKPTRVIDVDREILLIEREENIEYEKLQREAIRAAIDKNLFILTGGPGTGKTTTLNAIIKILRKNGCKVFLAAPTGRAAQRMTELTHRKAKTIHRMLEAAVMTGDESMFAKNESNKLKCDVLVLDESSMIDINLFSAVLKALPLGAKLILVGDSDQLPSVGPGNVLGDLIASDIVPYVRLSQIFRQSLDSLIVTNAHAIVNGEMPQLDVKNKDFFFLNCKTNDDIINTVVSLYTNRLPKNMKLDPLKDIQIITPTRKSPLGTFELNKTIQGVINPESEKKRDISVLYNTFRVDDKVMQNKNDYDVNWINTETGEVGQGVFNGDIGILKDIDRQNSRVKIQYDDRLAIYEGEQIENIELAYATTIHKSQGNEFNAVIIPVFYTSKQLMYRNLIYTGVTRAKKILILVGYPNALKGMIENNRKQLRYTGLKYFLI